MTINFSTSDDIVFSTFANLFIPTNLFISSSLIVFLPSMDPLLFVVLNITRRFYIEKPVINANNITVLNILKDTI